MPANSCGEHFMAGKEQIVQMMRENQSFLVFSHVSPDGDTLGSAAAVVLALRAMGKRAELALDGVLPDKLRFLKEYVSLLSEEQAAEFSKKCACMLAIDCGDRPRLGKPYDDLFGAFPCTGVVDHHPTNTRFGGVNWVENRASTGEMIFELLGELGVKIDARIANCLYAAISTDTGNFIYSSVTPQTFEIAARLCEQGADIPRLAAMIYGERSFGATKLIGDALTTLHLYEDGKIAVMHMTLARLYECGAKREDCEGLINYAREIQGVEIAIFINEMKDARCKISFRSKHYADMTKLSGEFGGGGHVHAAGAVMQGDIAEMERQLVAAARKYLRN